MERERARIPCLDGLRGLSIALVVFGHLGGTQGFPVGEPRLGLPFLASLGVRVFFIISGYLITRLLLMEQESRGSIHLPGFYFRRIFRILVPYYVFLAAMIAAARLGWIQLAPGDLGYALAYASNYHLHGAWALAHTWSLAVEEQFYLLWPALLVLLGARRALWIAAAYLAVAPVGRVLVFYLQPELREGIGHTFGTVADTVAAGCLLAGVSGFLWSKEWYRSLLRSRWFAVLPLAVLATVIVEDRPRLAFTAGAVIVNIGVALCIDRCVRLPESLATRLLAAAPMVAIGRVSYSIYLWQQPFLNRSAPGLAAHFPQNLIAVAVVATAAYFIVEKPALAARSTVETWLRRALGRPKVRTTVSVPARAHAA